MKSIPAGGGIRGVLARAGFTIMEVMVASAVSVIVLGGATFALIQGLQIWQQEDIKNELNLDLEIAMEKIRADLRLSSVGIGLMAFYPTNSSEYTAISMPLSEDSNNDGMLDRNTDDDIVWNKTIVYHVRPGSPDKLLRTVFSPRYTNATPELLYSQLVAVVGATNMAALQTTTMSGETCTSETVFENLVNLRFTPPDAFYDLYEPGVTRGNSFDWGSLVLGPGTHKLRLQVTGKNPLSSGYRVEVDRMRLSVSESSREGEIFIPNGSHPDGSYFVAVPDGGTIVALDRGEGSSWTGWGSMSFSPTGVGDTVTFDIYNDLITDSNFNNPPGAISSNCSVKYDSAFTNTDPFIPDIVVSPDKGTAWTATSCGTETNAATFTSYTTITNIIYGGTNNPYCRILRSGCWARYIFKRGRFCSLAITNAMVIDEATLVSSGITFNNGQTYVHMPVNGPETTNSDWVQMWETDAGKNYRVVFSTYEAFGDHDLDLFVGSDGPDGVRFYQNTGSKTAPAFGAGSPNWQGIVGGAATSLGFGDWDADGDQDLVVGIYQVSPYFKLYRNDGTPAVASMVQIPTPLALQNIGSWNSTPTLADIDDDGDLDLFSGFQSGNFAFCKNTGSPTNPVWVNNVSLLDGAGVVMDVGQNSSPELADMDNDGLLDLFSGGDDQYIRYWQNTGSATTARWTFVTGTYGGLTNDSTRCIPRFADINGDGLKDLFVGTLDGKITFYLNTGSATNASWSAPVNGYVSVPGSRAAPAFCNIDEDKNGAACWANDDVDVLSYIDGVPTNRIVGVNSFEVGYAKESVYRSGIFDTSKTVPAYNKLKWTSVEDPGNGWDVDVRVRSSARWNMSDLTDMNWEDAKSGDGGYIDASDYSMATLPRKRYLQYEVRLKCNELGSNPAAHTNEFPGAKLRDVTIDWPGPTGLVDLLIDFGKGPDCGIVEASVDGQSFVKGVIIKMEIFKEGRTGMQSTLGHLEVRPLNTGK